MGDFGFALPWITILKVILEDFPRRQFGQAAAKASTTEKAKLKLDQEVLARSAVLAAQGEAVEGTTENNLVVEGLIKHADDKDTK